MLGQTGGGVEFAQNPGCLLNRWPQIRGILIAIHVLAIVVGSLPVLVDERVLTPEAWNDPIAQQEFEAWADRLTALGMETTPDQFGQGAWNAASGILRVQRALTRPFEPYYHIVGTRQRWRMFPAAVEEPVRMRIDIESDGEWRTIYRMGSAQEDWGAPYFDRDRFRAALNLYAWGVYPESYEQFVNWLAEEVRTDFPEATRFRVGFQIEPAMKPGDSEKPGPLPMEDAKQLRIVELSR